MGSPALRSGPTGRPPRLVFTKLPGPQPGGQGGASGAVSGRGWGRRLKGKKCVLQCAVQCRRKEAGLCFKC